MIVGPSVLSYLLWGAVGAVAIGALYLLVALVIDWRSRTLW
ncbi:MAG: hypothetical protein RIF41_25640 [Polyangiaceae bacterium]